MEAKCSTTLKDGGLSSPAISSCGSHFSSTCINSIRYGSSGLHTPQRVAPLWGELTQGISITVPCSYYWWKPRLVLDLIQWNMIRGYMHHWIARPTQTHPELWIPLRPHIPIPGTASALSRLNTGFSARGRMSRPSNRGSIQKLFLKNAERAIKYLGLDSQIAKYATEVSHDPSSMDVVWALLTVSAGEYFDSNINP